MQDPNDTAIDDALAKFVSLQLEGRAPSLEEFLADYPDQADVLRQRLSDIQKLSRLWRDGVRNGSPDTLTEGTQIKDFAIRRQIGRGGMGTVYEAEQVSLRRQVALKVIQCQGLSPSTRERFLRESHTLARLSHPNLVAIHDAGDQDGCLFIAMEYVRGCTLAEALDAVHHGPSDGTAAGALRDACLRASLSATNTSDAAVSPASLDGEYIQRICGILIRVASALQYAHDQGVIHRDIKPSNILLTESGEPRLADFGLAAVNTEPHITLTGEFFGTPNYVSPEQARGQANHADVRSDVYSLGATLYECLTLEPPFNGTSASDVIAKVLTDEPVPARQRNPHLPIDLDTIIAKAMHREPSGRYASAQALAEDLERFLSYRPILARRPGATERLYKAVRRRPLRAVSILLAVVAATTTGLLGFHWHSARVAARALHLRQLLDSSDVLLYAAAAGPRPMWLQGELQRRKDAALAAYRQAIDLDPLNPWPYMQRARLQLLTDGDIQLARRDAEKVHELRPSWRAPTLFLSIARERTSASRPAAAPPAQASRPAGMPETPSDADDHYFLGVGWLMREDREEACRQFSQCFLLDPRHYWAYLDRSLWAVTSADPQILQPLRDLHAAQSLRPDLPLTWHLLAVSYWSKHELEAATDAMQKALQLAPNDLLLLLQMSDVCRDAGRNETAIAWMKKAIDHDPTGRCYCQLGNLYDRIREYDAALDSYDRCIATDPDYASAYVYKAQLLERLERYDEALRCSQQALRARFDRYDPSQRGNAVETLARILADMNRTEEALQAYGQALELPRYERPHTYMDMADLCQKINRLGEAESLLRKGIEECDRSKDLTERSQSADLKGKLAELLWSEGERERAVQVFQPVPSEPAVRAAHHYVCGSFLWDRAMPEAAEREWRKCVGLPGLYDSLARGKLRFLYELAGRYDEAIEECEVLMDTQPGDFHHQVHLAICYEKKSDFRRAIQICQEGIGRYGGHWEFDQVLGRVLNRLGEYDRSDSHFQQALAASSHPTGADRVGREILVKEYAEVLIGRTQRPADIRRGLEFCKTAIGEDKPSDWLRYELSCMIAWASIQLNQPQDAEQAARNAVRLSGGTPVCWISLGLALKQQGRPFEAIDALIEAGDLETQLAPVHHQVMTELTLGRRCDRAISVIDRWLTRKQSETAGIGGERRRAGLLLYKAGMLARTHRLAEASKILESVASGLPKLLSSCPIDL